MLLALIIAPSYIANSQTPNSSTVSIDETINVLLKKNRENKEAIAVRDERISDLETEVAVEKENSASVGKSYEAAKVEIATLKSAVELYQKAITANEQTIALLQGDNAKQKEKAKKATKAKWKAYGAAAVTILITYVLH